MIHLEHKDGDIILDGNNNINKSNEKHMIKHLTTLSEGERSLLAVKAALGREKAKERANNELKTEWLDDSLWIELAQKANIKLPFKNKFPSTRSIDKIATQLGINDGSFAMNFFGKNTIGVGLKYERTHQTPGSLTSMRAYVGMMLEMWKEKQCVN